MREQIEQTLQNIQSRYNDENSLQSNLKINLLENVKYENLPILPEDRLTLKEHSFQHFINQLLGNITTLNTDSFKSQSSVYNGESSLQIFKNHLKKELQDIVFRTANNNKVDMAWDESNPHLPLTPRHDGKAQL